MKTALAAILLLAATPALAQVPERSYTLVVTGGEIEIIARGLGELPAKTVNPLIVKLNQQISAQDKPPPPAEPAKPEPKP